MELEERLVLKLEKLGPIYRKKMFGWICILSGRNFFGGYKILDDNILIMFLVMSPTGFTKAVATDDFQPFEFGKTWVETELSQPEDINVIWPFIKDAFSYTQKRKDKKSLFERKNSRKKKNQH